MKVTVKSNSNIALVKYWGKKNSNLKTPLNNSISMTLDSLFTITSFEIIESEKDLIFFNGSELPGKKTEKIIRFVDLFRKNFKRNEKFRIETKNNFPDSAGLASSASGFSALAFGMDKIMNLNLEPKEISIYARLGSGSASRSIYGGFAEWLKGESEDGKDSYAIQIADENYWKLGMLVCITETKEKDKSSTDGMEETVKSCPFYPAWLSTIENDLHEVRNGILSKDLEKVGNTMEHNCLKMHSTMFTTRPANIYWQSGTIEIIHLVYEIRKNGIECYFTIDAGPNVKILCKPEDISKIKNKLENIKSIKNIIECFPGKSPEIIF